MSPKEAAAKLGVLPKELRQGYVRAIRRGATYWRKLTLQGITTRGIGRGIWGGKKLTTLRKIVKRDRVKASGDIVFTAGLTMKGIAALMEVGGRTKPHIIKANKARALVFVGRKGLVRLKYVNHPGSRVPGTPSASPVVGDVSVKTRAEIEIEMTKAIAKVGLNG